MKSAARTGYVEDVLAAVRALPPGRSATYRELARAARRAESSISAAVGILERRGLVTVVRVGQPHRVRLGTGSPPAPPAPDPPADTADRLLNGTAARMEIDAARLREKAERLEAAARLLKPFLDGPAAPVMGGAGDGI